MGLQDRRVILRFKGFIGPSYTLKSVNVDCQRCVNLYPELNELGTGKEAEVAWLRSTPGLEELLSVGTGPIRLVHYDNTPVSDDNPTTRVFVVSGNKLYKVTYNTGTSSWESSEEGTFETSTGIVRAASISLNLGLTVFVDGTNSYIWQRYDSGGGIIVEEFDNFAGYGYPSVEYANHVVYLDGYFIFSALNSNEFNVSEINSLNIDPLSFASAEGDPDNIVGIISNSRDLWLFGERSTEVWANTGNADFPFERVSNGFLEKGCVAAGSIAKLDGNVFWLGRDSSGQGIVYTGRGLSANRISTHAVETAIQGYSDISTAQAYTYQSGGHSFYVLNFAEGTWVYDLMTNLWHERAYTNEGVLERHRANFCQFLPEFGFHMLGDYSSTKIYRFNDDVYTDDGDAITRLRTAPHVSSNLKNVFHKSFQLDMETGVGTESGQGSDPQVVMDYSNDGGHTWSDEAWASAGQNMGGVGEYKTRVIWRRLGMARDRVYRVKITDPVKVALIGAELDVQVGAS